MANKWIWGWIAGFALLVAGCGSGSVSQEPEPCEGVTCSGHGICVAAGDQASCDCEEGFQPSGLECLTEGDPCAGVTCSGHGSCVKVAGQASCDCDPGFVAAGLECEPEVDRCAGIDCGPGGACDDSFGSPVCTCGPGYRNENPTTCVPIEGDSALATAAAAMQPGQWVELDTQGFDDGAIFVTDDDGSILEYNSEAVWDPIGRRLIVAGTARGASAEYGMINQKWVQWSEATNTWTSLPQMPFYLGFHSYDHAALDTTNGDYYLRIVGSSEVQRFGAAEGTWGPIANIPMGYESCCNALEYFPDMGALVFVRGSSDGDTEIFRYLPGQDAWERLAADTPMPMGNYHDFAEVSHANGALVFGGGDVYQVGLRAELYAMDDRGQVGQLPDAPFAFDLSGTLAVTEPAAGNLLLFPVDDLTTFHELDLDTGVWHERPIDPIFRYESAYAPGLVATAISDYGVVVFLRHAVSAGGSGVFLYKPAPP